MEAVRASVPARRVPGRRRRLAGPAGSSSRTRCAARHGSRGPVGRRRPGRDVPALAVLPAAAVVDQAVRAGRAAAPASTSGTTGTACSPTSPRRARSRPEFMDGVVLLPVAARDAGEPRGLRGAGRDLASATAPAGRRRARGRPTARSSSRPATASTAAGILVFAVGVAQPWSPTRPGIELARHYAETRDAASYAGKRMFIIGKQNSGFELATGLAQWARRIVCSPSPAKTASRRSRWPASGPATSSRSRTRSSASASAS